MKKYVSFILALIFSLSFCALAEVTVSVTVTTDESGDMAVFSGEEDGCEKWHLTFTGTTMADADGISWFTPSSGDTLYVHVADTGLSAYDTQTGSLLWSIPITERLFGTDCSMARDDAGTLYIGGCYGPDPIAIDKAGNILWAANASEEGNNDGIDNTGLMCLVITDGKLMALYASSGKDDAGISGGYALFDLTDGSLIERGLSSAGTVIASLDKIASLDAFAGENDILTVAVSCLDQWENISVDDCPYLDELVQSVISIYDPAFETSLFSVREVAEKILSGDSEMMDQINEYAIEQWHDTYSGDTARYIFGMIGEDADE